MANKFLGVVVFAFVFLMLMQLSSAVSQSCCEPADNLANCSDRYCSQGELCGGEGKCIPCRTSAECVDSTFQKSLPEVAGAVSPWFMISLLAVLIAISATAIIFMVGYALNSDQIRRIGKAELMQALASLILVALLFGTEVFEGTLMTMMERQTGIFTAAAFSPQEFNARQAAGQILEINPFDVSFAFLRKLDGCINTLYLRNYEASLPYEFMANLQLFTQIDLPLLGSVGTPTSPLAFNPSISQGLYEKEYIGDELTWLGIFVYMQVAMMKFIQTSMFTMFLPIGIILRAFPPTRGAGAVMIALAIGLYIVYPFTYAMLVSGSPKTIGGCNLIVDSSSSGIGAACPIAVGSASSSIEQAQTAASTVELDMPQIRAGGTSIRYMAWIYMLISLGAAFLFTRSISSILGADISEIGRSMFKLV